MRASGNAAKESNRLAPAPAPSTGTCTQHRHQHRHGAHSPLTAPHQHHRHHRYLGGPNWGMTPGYIAKDFCGAAHCSCTLQLPPTAPAPSLQSALDQRHIAAAFSAALCSGSSNQVPKCTQPHIRQQRPAAAPAPKLQSSSIQSAHRHLFLYLK